MREIKFRIWDRNSLKFFDMENSEYAVSPEFVYDESYDCRSERYLIGHDVDVMQYTGMPDANGVDAYEGDIIQALPNGVRYEIKWIDGVGFMAISKYVQSPLFSQLGKFGNAQILGNIYQNPELMEVNNG